MTNQITPKPPHWRFFYSCRSPPHQIDRLYISKSADLGNCIRLEKKNVAKLQLSPVADVLQQGFVS